MRVRHFWYWSYRGFGFAWRSREFVLGPLN